MSSRTIAPLTIAEGSRLFRESWRVIAEHKGALLRLALPWLLFRLVVVPFDVLSWVSVREVVHFMGWSVISVSWYRFVLLSIPAPIAGRFEWREMRYIITNLLALIPFHVITLLVVAVAAAPARNFRLSFIELLYDLRSSLVPSEVASVVYLLVLARFQLLFPAIALDEGASAISRSLKLTRGSTGAIFLWSLVAAAPGFIPSLSELFPDFRTPGLALVMSDSLDFVEGLFGEIVPVTFFALLYRRHTGNLASIFE